MKHWFFYFFVCTCLLSCQSYTEKVQVTIEQPVLPVLVHKNANPVLKIELVKDGLSVCTVDEVSFSLQGTTDLADINNVSLFGTDATGMLSEGQTLSLPQQASPVVTFKNKIPFESDTLCFWVSVRLKDKVDLTHQIHITCQNIVTSDGKVDLETIQPTKDLRVGVAVRQHQQDGVDTYRIPGLVTSKRGTLLAIYDARHESSRDLQGDIDISLNRSRDGGQTWEPLQTILDMKEWGGLPEKYNGVSDANILVDENTGDIYVAGLWMHGVLDGNTGKWVEGMTKDSTRWIHQWVRKGSQPGLDVKETSQFLITKSTDDGLTWSEPVNITAQTKRKEWWLYAPAPGQGITLKDGTLVFPTQGRDSNGLPFSNITWSKDGGKTWKASNPAFSDVTECMAVQLSDNSVMLNMRDNRNRTDSISNGRRVCITTDLGQTWVEHPTSRKALIEPVCMASLHKHLYQENGMEKSILLFANPDSKINRDHLTLKVSYDDGNTWPEDKKILLDEYLGRGYSCITSVNDSVIGILYESSQADMVFQQIRLEELIN